MRLASVFVRITLVAAAMPLLASATGCSTYRCYGGDVVGFAVGYYAVTLVGLLCLWGAVGATAPDDKAFCNFASGIGLTLAPLFLLVSAFTASGETRATLDPRNSEPVKPSTEVKSDDTSSPGNSTATGAYVGRSDDDSFLRYSAAGLPVLPALPAYHATPWGGLLAALALLSLCGAVLGAASTAVTLLIGTADRAPARWGVVGAVLCFVAHVLAMIAGSYQSLGSADAHQHFTWRQELAGLDQSLVEFRSARQTASDKLRQTGLRGAAELAKNAKAKAYANELLQIDRELELLTQKRDAYDVAITQLAILLRARARSENLAKHGFSSDDVKSRFEKANITIQQKMHALNAEEPAADLALEALIRKELGEAATPDAGEAPITDKPATDAPKTDAPATDAPRTK